MRELLKSKTVEKQQDLEENPTYRTWGKLRSLRLKDFDYASPLYVYHIVIGTKGRKEIFTFPPINREVIRILKDSVGLYGYYLISYCLMPDHLHILIQAGDSPKNLNNFVRGFKSYVTKSTGRKLWQRGFYEHILRKEENIHVIGEYILNNPIRKGLVTDRREYPWCEWIEEFRLHRSEDAT
jgi:REP element-mobilizing transposase RayT